MFDRTGNILIIAILAGMILGVVAVAIFGEAVLPVKFLGDIFLNALKMVVIPLLFCSMVVGITQLGDVRKLGRTGLKTLAYFLATSSIAVIIGLILVNIIQPGVGFSLFSGNVSRVIERPESYSFLGWLADQVPANIVGAAAETKVLPIIVFALFFGGVLTTLGVRGKPVITLFEGINEAIMKIVHIIMWFAPIGIFGLVAGQLAATGGMSEFANVLSGLGKYALVVLLGLVLHGVIVLPLILKFMGGKNPIEYFVGMSQALMTAFATASSSATLPVSMECVEEKNNVDKRASSFVLPLGATINMDGTALYEAVAAMFIAQAYGIDLSIFAQITIFATAVLASIGAAGIPQAGLVTMVLVLQAVGLPLEGIGLILAIDWFLDRCRTTVNVWGDSIGAAVIATTAEIGLVDRQRKREPGFSRPGGRPARFKVSGRRDERYGQRKPADSPQQSQQKSPMPPRGKQTDSQQKGTDRYPDRRSRKSPRSEQRTARKEQRTAVMKDRDPRDRYKPADDKKPESMPEKGRPPSPPMAPAPPQHSPKPKPQPAPEPKRVQGEGRDTARPVFGRKRTRPPHTQGKSSAKSAPGQDETTKGEKAIGDAVDSRKNVEYEIPQFPKSILDDLTSPMEPHNHGSAGRPDKDRADTDAGKKDDRKEPAIQITHNAGKDREMVSGDVSISASESEEQVDHMPVSDDFSRLDEAVLGIGQIRTSEVHGGPSHHQDNDGRATDTKEADSHEESKTESAAADVVAPPAAKAVTRGSRSGYAGEQGPDEEGHSDVKADISISDDEKSSEAVSEDNISEPVASLPPKTDVSDTDDDGSDDEISERDAGESDDARSEDSSEEADEEEDDDSEMKWGRQKRRRPSR